MKKIILIFSVFFLLFSIQSCNRKSSNEIDLAPNGDTTTGKVLIVHSYHPESRRVMEHNETISRILSDQNMDFRFFYMDTHRNNVEEYIKNIALEAKDEIDSYNPNVVITFDDNAFKYLIMPYYRDSQLPVVFSGLDWDISVYEAPYSNTTGMISVTLMDQLIDHLKEYASGTKVVWLGYDTLTARKETSAYQNILNLDMDVRFIHSYEEWKDAFLELQSEADILIHSGILTDMHDWDANDAAEYVFSNIKIPVGTVNKTAMGISMMGITVVPTEQGRWAAERAIEIIEGKSPSQIPVTNNKEGNIIINLDLLERLDIRISSKILKSATLYEADEE